MSDRADSNIPLNSVITIEQAIKQAYLKFQAYLSHARYPSVEAKHSSSDPSSTPHLIPSQKKINIEYSIPCNSTLDLER